MHVVIINGSPRVQKYSNTEKIIASFTKGLSEKGASFEAYAILSFLLQSGFAEGCQLRCGEEFLAKLPGYLGVRYGGCLVKGDNFGIRVLDEEKQRQVTKPYQEMMEYYAGLVRKYGNLVAQYRNAICFVMDEKHIYEAMESSMYSEKFILTDIPHSKIRKKGFPLDSMSIDMKTNRYYYDLAEDELAQFDVEDGFLQFFQKVLSLD